MSTVKRYIAAGIMAAFAGSVAAQTAPAAPKDPSKADYIADINKAADIIQAGTKKYCKPEHDGDKSKGEYTNADVATLVRGWATLPDKNPTISLELVHAIATGVASNDVTVCMDKRVKELGTNNVPAAGQQFLETHHIQAALYPAATTLSFNPKPVAPAASKDATSLALLYSFNGLGKRINQLNEAGAFAQLGIPQAVQIVNGLTSTPLLYLYNPSAPETSASGPSLNALHLFENPVIQGSDTLPSAQPQPQPSGNRPLGERPKSYSI